MRRIVTLLTLFAVVSLTQGCAKLFGLRPDMNDGYGSQPTSGGVWPERQMLDDADLQAPSAYDDYSAVGHSERLPPGRVAQQPARWNTDPNVERVGTPDEVAQQEQQQMARAQAGAQKFKNGNRATKADFVDDSQSEGSLWASGGQTNYFFTKNSVKNPGDIITVKMDNPFIKDVAAEVKRGLSDDEMDDELAQAKKKKNRSPASADPNAPSPAPGTDQTPSSAAAAKSGDNQADLFGGGDDAKVTPADVDLSSSIGLKAGDTVMAEILERYPSGNYKIRGTKRVNYHGTMRMMTFVAIARSNDISEADVIDSAKLYEYKLNVQR